MSAILALSETYSVLLEESNKEDHDNDGINDLNDLDDDNDGIYDLLERFDGCYGTDPLDHDNDGIPDVDDWDDDNDEFGRPLDIDALEAQGLTRLTSQPTDTLILVLFIHGPGNLLGTVLSRSKPYGP